MHIEIEIPRGSFIKWDQGKIEYISPIPCPFNYGSIPNTLGPDGDPADALALGPPHPRGTHLDLPCWGAVQFLDAGVADSKHVLSATPPTTSEKRMVERFFRVYAIARTLLNLLQRKPGKTSYQGVRWEVGTEPPPPRSSRT